MRYYSAFVNIAGDRNAVVRKTHLTAAEIMVLQAIHGHGEVYDISKEPSSGRDNTPHATVREHLDRRYGRVRVGPSSDRRPVLVAVFPGWPNVKMPSDAESADLDPVLFSEADKPKKSAPKRGAAKAEEPQGPDFTE